MTKKIKKEESYEESVPKKGKKKEKQLTPEQAAHKEYLSTFPSFRARTTPSSLFSAIRNSRVDILGFFSTQCFHRQHPIEVRMVLLVQCFLNSYMLEAWITGDKIEVTRQKIHDMLGVPVGGYSLFDLDEREADHEFVKLWLVAAKEINFLFKVNFLTLFTNTMGKADGLKGQICLDVTEAEVQDAKGFIGSSEISKKVALFKRAKKKLAAIYSEIVHLENLIRKASSDYPGDGKFVELQEKYVQVFRDPISFDVDVDAGNDGNGDDDGDDDNDNDSDGNSD
ncbi:hypothetical protein Tco_0489167 [Tanacetum coccineum]